MTRLFLKNGDSVCLLAPLSIAPEWVPEVDIDDDIVIEGLPGGGNGGDRRTNSGSASAGDNSGGQSRKQSPAIHPIEISGKTAEELEKVALDKGLIPKGPDPKTGRGAFRLSSLPFEQPQRGETWTRRNCCKPRIT